MTITNPQAVKFCNKNIRVAADMSSFRQTLIQYEGQVAALLQENEQLKKEIESLRSEAKSFDGEESK
jgi:cell division septum initiation protein DivIVA